jgi:hypothetical protein
MTLKHPHPPTGRDDSGFQEGEAEDEFTQSNPLARTAPHPPTATPSEEPPKGPQGSDPIEEAESVLRLRLARIRQMTGGTISDDVGPHRAKAPIPRKSIAAAISLGRARLAKGPTAEEAVAAQQGVMLLMLQSLTLFLLSILFYRPGDTPLYATLATLDLGMILESITLRFLTRSFYQSLQQNLVSIPFTTVLQGLYHGKPAVGLQLGEEHCAG